MRPALSQRSSAASTKISNCRRRPEKLLLLWLAPNKNDNTFCEGKVWVFSDVGNSGGPTPTSQKSVFRKTEKGKATYLPGWDQHERIGAITALQTQEQGSERRQHWAEPSNTSLLSASTEGSEGLQCKFVHDILGYFCLIAFKKSSFSSPYWENCSQSKPMFYCTHMLSQCCAPELQGCTATICR